MDAHAALKAYRAKRNFAVTAEPAEGGDAAADGALRFVVQKHWASSLHYDFRLEVDGTMKSWAVPKGPSLDPADKRLAVRVEDHPISYAGFEGTIPKGQYGAGKVIVWDAGRWTPVGDPAQGLRAGKLVFALHGHKLQGRWALVRMKGKGTDSEKQPPWLLRKEQDGFGRPAAEFSVVDEMPDSVLGSKPPATTPQARAAAEGPPPAALPATLAPHLATLVAKAPADPAEWVYEIKFDGYRLLARVQGQQVQLFTRNGNDWTHKLKALHAELQRMALPDGWYDGEMVVLHAQGVPDFGALQQAFDAAGTAAIVYYLFDVPFCGGHDLREQPLVARRALLQGVLAERASTQVRFSEVFDAPPGDVVQSACKLGLEGVIAKRKDSAYLGRRADSWVKLKCSQRQEFVIAGFTAPQGARTGLGSLLLGVHDKAGALVYAGNVGTGFSQAVLKDLARKLKALKTERSPLADTAGVEGRPQWVEPHLIAEVSFGEWTRSGRIRHAVFHGLRADNPPASIVRERPAAAPKAAAASRKKPAAAPSHALSSRLKVTNPGRVIDASTGTTKIELVRYYALVGPLMLQHLKGRPVSLVRAPAVIGKPLFFQNHAEVQKLPGVRQLDPGLDPDHPPMLEIATAQGLLLAAQWNMVEIHAMNALAAHFEQPQAIVQHLAKTIPDRFVAKSGPRNRVGKIFIDYLRNGQGATTVCAWSARARPGLGISVPLAWDELAGLTSSDQWSVRNVQQRLEVGNAPWAGYARAARSLTAAMQALGYNK